MTAPATRDRIVAAAADLLAAGSREAVSTRAVSAAAGVQAPTIYRLFGDKQGLLDAVAVHGFTTYLRDKAELAHGDDPVEELRTGWDLHVKFGLANPALYALMYGEPRPGPTPPAPAAAAAILAGHLHRIAEAAGCGSTRSGPPGSSTPPAAGPRSR
jgi:AcrR family transcriptional regulator